MPVYSYRGVAPRLADGVFLAPGASVIGDVELGSEVSVWFNAVVRADVNTIRIGARTNIQDGSVLHVTHRLHRLEIGSDVVVGHGAILHGCRIEDGALIGIGARILDGAVVEAGGQVGAGAVVTPGTEVPAGQLAVGIPARAVRALGPEERDEIAAIVKRYALLKERYRKALGSGCELADSVETAG
jgi:carbonic anhydrase/acetyltransferase-like protein (isoleucine patch superfamily)